MNKVCIFQMITPVTDFTHKMNDRKEDIIGFKWLEKYISLPFIVLLLVAIKHRMFLWTWARFFSERPGNFFGPEGKF